MRTDEIRGEIGGGVSGRSEMTAKKDNRDWMSLRVKKISGKIGGGLQAKSK